MARLPKLLRLLLTALLVAVAAGAAGAAVGYGLGKAKFGDPAPVPQSRGTTGTTGPTASVATPATPASPGGTSDATLRVRVLRAELVEAATPAGRARDRASLQVRVEARNQGTTVAMLRAPEVQVGADSQAADPRAREVAGRLYSGIPAGSTATGLLRFETAGALTKALREGRQADLRVAGQTLTVSF